MSPSSNGAGSKSPSSPGNPFSLASATSYSSWEEISAELKARLDYIGHLKVFGDPVLVMINNWNCDENSLLLYDVLIDSSETVEGVITKRRFTYHQRLLVVGHFSFLARLMSMAERMEGKS